ncbi:MAG TPA: hypothetical protein VGG02_08230 [Chthoniobacterales bacterium]
MYNRYTGEIVGPVAPVFSEDWPYEVVADHETLWRYMELWKFEDMLKRSTIYFARADQFDEPFEGRESPGNTETMSKSEEAFQKLYPVKRPENWKESQETIRQVMFISCWNRGTRECWEMWRGYTKTPNSVVIATSAKALRRFVPEEIMKYGVKYASLDFPRTEFTHTSLFFYKPASCRIEREYRMLRVPREDESIASEDLCRHIPIKLRKIVRRVVTHPGATRETKQRVTDLLRDYLPSRRREDSALTV